MNCMKKTAVEVSDVIKKMSDHMPESFFRHYILLAALMAETSYYSSAAVQAILFLSLRNMRHCNFFLKIGTKNTSSLSFSLLNYSITFEE